MKEIRFLFSKKGEDYGSDQDVTLTIFQVKKGFLYKKTCLHRRPEYIKKGVIGLEVFL